MPRHYGMRGKTLRGGGMNPGVTRKKRVKALTAKRKRAGNVKKTSRYK